MRMDKTEAKQYEKKNPEKAGRIKMAVRKALSQYGATFKKLSQT